MKKKSLLILMVVGLSLVLSAVFANAAEPLMIKDLEKATTTIVDGRGNSHPPVDEPLWDIAFMATDPQSAPTNVAGRIEIYTNEYRFSDTGKDVWIKPYTIFLAFEGITTGAPPLVDEGNTVTITYDGGQILTIYLPAISGNTLLYVATDGSTYYAGDWPPDKDPILTGANLAQAAPSDVIPGGESKAIGRASQGVLDDMIINTVNYLIANDYLPTNLISWSKQGNLYQINFFNAVGGWGTPFFQVKLGESDKTYLKAGWQQKQPWREGIYTNQEILWREVIKRVEQQGKKGKSGK